MDEFLVPTVEYGDYKKDPDNYVRVGVDIKGLRKATFGQKAANADIELTVTDRSMCLTVIPKDKAKVAKCRFEVKRLPAEISTDEKLTYFKVEKNDEVTIYLRKASSGSWARYLSSSGPGLETEGTSS